MTRPLNILVVDDDVDNAMSMGELFEMEGHHVSMVHSGQAAIDACISTQFDIAFIDVMMPGKNGVESFLEIRRVRPEARVYMMTGYSVEELLQQAVREGAMGYLEKPFEPEEVLRITDQVGQGGLVVALPRAPQSLTGDAIVQTLENNGKPCSRIRHPAALTQAKLGSEVVIIEAPLLLIDAVSGYRQLCNAQQGVTTIIVPQDGAMSPLDDSALSDVGVTGILNKPFDPLDLINRLPQLAA